MNEAVVERLRPLHGQVDEGNGLRKVPPGRGIVAQIEQSLPKRVMRREEVRRRRLALCQAVKFCPQLHCRRQGPSAAIEPP